MKRFMIHGVIALLLLHSAVAFQGRIAATLTRGGDAQNLVYIVGTNLLRIERTETNWPYARDIVNLQSGEMTMLFPHNRSFVRLKPETQAPGASLVPGRPALPATAGAPQPTAQPYSPDGSPPGARGLAGM